MSLGNKVSALKVKHQALESAIESERSRPQPDNVEVHSLKKRKLLIKDEITALSG